MQFRPTVSAVALLGVVVCFAKKQHCYYKPEHIQPSQPLGNDDGGAHGGGAYREPKESDWTLRFRALPPPPPCRHAVVPPQPL